MTIRGEHRLLEHGLKHFVRLTSSGTRTKNTPDVGIPRSTEKPGRVPRGLTLEWFTYSGNSAKAQEFTGITHFWLGITP
jgi:hypothetical protein